MIPSWERDSVKSFPKVKRYDPSLPTTQNFSCYIVQIAVDRWQPRWLLDDMFGRNGECGWYHR
jgi:hypothetical protein